MTEGPHFIVVKGTNQRWTTGKDQTPRIYDTEEIAQIAINDDIEFRKAVDLKPLKKRVPISIAEYNKKYAKLMGIKED